MTMVATDRPVLGKQSTYLYDGLYTYSVYEWDEATQAVVGRGVGTGYDGAPAEYVQTVVTATPEVKAKADAWARERAFKRERESYANEAERLANAVTKGVRVTVVKGRKVPVGTEGEVLWIQDYGYMSVLLGLGERGADGQYANTVFSYLKNVKRSDYEPERYMRTEDEIRELVASTKWSV